MDDMLLRIGIAIVLTTMIVMATFALSKTKFMERIWGWCDEKGEMGEYLFVGTGLVWAVIAAVVIMGIVEITNKMRA